MNYLEHLMYQVSGYFMMPVLLLLVILFAYTCYQTGCFIMQFWQRKSGSTQYKSMLSNLDDSDHSIPKGYPILTLAKSQSIINKDELDVAAMKELEGVRAVSRLAPMLGLIATMIPMGPALKSLANGNIQGISENLIIAFSAVIFGLVIASVTFWIASIKKKWLASELVDVTKTLDKAENKSKEQGV